MPLLQEAFLGGGRGTAGQAIPLPDNILDFANGVYTIDSVSFTVDEVVANPSRVSGLGLNLTWPADFSDSFAEPMVDPALSAVLAHMGEDFSVVLEVYTVGDDSGTEAYPFWMAQGGSSPDPYQDVFVWFDDYSFYNPETYSGGGVADNTSSVYGRAAYGISSPPVAAPALHRIALRREADAWDGGERGGLFISVDGQAANVDEGDGAAPGLDVDAIYFGGQAADQLLGMSLVLRSVAFYDPIDNTLLPYYSALGRMPLLIYGTAVTTGLRNVAYDGFTTRAYGGRPPYVYSLNGSWPTGLSVDQDGVVSGTPTNFGTFADISVRVEDSFGQTDDLTFTLEVAPIVISGTPIHVVVSGDSSYSFFAVAAGGVPPYAFSVQAGSLPTGLSLDASTGEVSGTPTVTERQSGIVIRVTDDDGQTADLTVGSIFIFATEDEWMLADSWSHSSDVPYVDFLELDGVGEVIVEVRGITLGSAENRDLQVYAGQNLLATLNDYYQIWRSGSEAAPTPAELIGQVASTTAARSAMFHVWLWAQEHEKPILTLTRSASNERAAIVASDVPLTGLRIKSSGGSNMTAGTIAVLARK